MPDSAITTSASSSQDLSKEFFVPTILVVGQSSSHESSLLEVMSAGKVLSHQQKYQYKSEYIAINQIGSSIGIDEVRALSEQLSFSVQQNSVRFVLIYHADFLTLPAQQALLKLLEEPPARTQLWLTVASADILIETIRSRCYIQYASKDIAIEQNEYKNVAEQLLRDIPRLSLRELTEVSELYKENVQSLALTNAVLTELLALLEQTPTPQLREATGLALKTQLLLSTTNTNPRLVLESLLFNLKNKIQHS